MKEDTIFTSSHTAVAERRAERAAPHIITDNSLGGGLRTCLRLRPCTSWCSLAVGLSNPERARHGFPLVQTDMCNLVKHAALAFAGDLIGQLAACHFAGTCLVAVVQGLVPRAALEVMEALRMT